MQGYIWNFTECAKGETNHFLCGQDAGGTKTLQVKEDAMGILFRVINSYIHTNDIQKETMFVLISTIIFVNSIIHDYKLSEHIQKKWP